MRQIDNWQIDAQMRQYSWTQSFLIINMLGFEPTNTYLVGPRLQNVKFGSPWLQKLHPTLVYALSSEELEKKSEL